MPNKFAEATQRNFDRMSTPKLSDDARKAVNAAFEAMSTWREEIVNEKNSEQVIEKMAEAARELGWPEQIIDATRMQMEAITKNANSNDGSRDGYLEGADRITEFVIDDAIEANILAQLRAGRQLA